VRRLARIHPRIEVEGVSGNPPDLYRIILEVRSLREEGNGIVVADRHRLEVALPGGYPRDAPFCRMLTPVFHPNIAPHAVCIGDHWSAGESLDLMIQRVGEMLAFQSYNVKSPLNGLAARWVEENLDRLPVDDREFFLDLSSAPPEASEGACSNCDADTDSPTTCPSGHLLCPDCATRCETCGGLVCFVCGHEEYQACRSPACSNCGAENATTLTCSTGHSLCTDCAVMCDTCGRALCIVCGEYPCSRCSEA